MIRSFFVFLIPLLCSVLFIHGCGNYFQPLQRRQATIGEPSSNYRALLSLPAPKEKIVAAVYKFRDQTGQYKPSSTTSSFSTAVTQGATSILLKALEESGWFVPIEREGLSNLLNERKIIRSSRAEYMGNSAEETKQPLLPPLLFAGVLLEGGIISFDSNILTGGSGLKYFGVGASGQYRQDRITIYLRAISTQNGRILKTVYTSKTILSQAVDANLFKYVNFQRLLEVETGYSYNEPPEVCVREAIEKAVQSLIIEGVFDNLWELKHPSDMTSLPIQTYIREREEAKTSDYFGEQLYNRGFFAVSADAGGQIYAGDYPNAETKPAFSASAIVNLSPELGVQLRFGRGRVAAQQYFSSTQNFAEVNVLYRMLPQYRLTPFITGGAGMCITTTQAEYSNVGTVVNKWLTTLCAGAGMEYLIFNNIGLAMSGEWQYLLSDDLDAMNKGKYYDYFWVARFGLTWYFGSW